MECVAQVEIDPAARGVLSHHWPGVHRLADIRGAGKHNLPVCDVICGGFPCQDLSVAGLRAGLSSERSGLFYEMTRICDELKPSFICWENVPGLLSSDDGRDFARVLMELGRIGYSGVWTTLDAQHFGLAQRRRRIFGVFTRQDIGAECCAEILSFAARMRWHPAPGRGKRADVAAPLTAGIGSGGRPSGRRQEDDFNIVTAGTQSPGGHPGSYNGQDAHSGLLIAAPVKAAPRVARQGKGSFGDPANDNIVVTPFDTTQITSPGNYSMPQPGQPMHPLSATAHPPTIAFALRGRESGAQVEVSGDRVNALRGAEGGSSRDYVAGIFNGYTGGADDNDARASHLVADTLNSGGNSGGFRTEPGARQMRAGHGVRRLTPRECERLQGFPDDWTRWRADGHGQPHEQTDSPRYRQLGNAVAVPCAEWIGRRIVAVVAAMAGPEMQS